MNAGKRSWACSRRKTLRPRSPNAALAHFDVLFPAGFELNGEEVVKIAFREVGISSKSRSGKRRGKIMNCGWKIRMMRENHRAGQRKIAENPLARNQLLGILDMLWMNNLDDLESLSQSVALRAYGQHDPLVEYRQESHRLFKNFWANYNAWIFGNIFKLAARDAGPKPAEVIWPRSPQRPAPYREKK